jgi:hypothetical protein
MSVFDQMGWSSKGAEGTGNSVGNAQGRFTIDTSSFAQARSEILRESRAMNAAIKQSLGDTAKQTALQTRAEAQAYNDLLKSLKRDYQDRLKQEKTLTKQIEREAAERLKIEKKAAAERAKLQEARMTALGGATVAATGLGLAAAQDIKVLRAQFKLFYGDQRKSTEEMERLRDLAEKLNQPFLEVLRNATELIPAVKGTTAELAQATIISQKLATLLPEMASRAGFALREFSVGQYMSLTRVFNLNREKLKEILDLANGDVKVAFDLLDEYLSQLGVTTDKLAEVGRDTNAFKVLRSELTETLATGFMPLRDALSDITWGLSDMLRTVRELHPDLLKVASTLAVIIALSQSGRVAGALPVVGQFAKGLGLPSVSAGTLGKAGLYAGVGVGSAYVGALAGKQIVRGIGAVTGREDLQQFSLNEALTTLKKGLYAIAYALGSFAKHIADMSTGWDDMWASLQQKIIDALTEAINGIIGLINNIPGVHVEKVAKTNVRAGRDINRAQEAATQFLTLPPEAQNQATQWATRRGMSTGDFLANITQITEAFKTATAQGRDFVTVLDETYDDQAITSADKFHEDINQWLLDLGKTMGIIEEGKGHQGQLSSNRMGGINPSELQMTDELLAEWQKFQQDLFDIAVEYDQKITDLTLDHNNDLADLYQQLGDDLVQAAADEAERYQEALQKARDSELEIRTDLADKLAEDDADLADKLLELQDDYQKADEKATKDHLKALLRIQEEGRLAILSAAARLDGVAVWEAMQRMKQQLKDEQDNYQDERKERQKRLDDQIADELKAHEKRAAQDQREADKKIAKLWEQYRKEETAAAADYSKKLADLRKNFVDQQTEYGKQYTQRLNQLIAQGAAEKQQREQSWLDTFNAIEEEAGVHEDALLKIHQDGSAAIEAQLTAWYNGMIAKFAQTTGVMGTPITPVGSLLRAPLKQGGGRLAATGLFRGERGETVLRQDTTRQISRMLGDNWTPSSLTAALAGGRQRERGPVGPIAINIYGETRRSDAEIENLVRHELVQVFEGL